MQNLQWDYSINMTIKNNYIKADNTKPSLMTITDNAWQHIHDLLSAENIANNYCGLRLTIDTRGCNGKSYKLQQVEKVLPMDEVMQKDESKVYIDPMAVMYLIGTVMDWKKNEFGAGFIFDNPNVKSMCGCGESFSI